jgi:hypothetical protein
MFGKINAQKLHSPSGTIEAKRPIEDLTNNEGDDEERRKKVRVTPPPRLRHQKAHTKYQKEDHEGGSEAGVFGYRP